MSDTPGPRPLVDLLLASLEQLAAAGENEAACRLAGEACARIRRSNPQTAHRFNLLLHRLVARENARKARPRE